METKLMTPIAQAVEPLRAAAAESARESALLVAETARKQLEQAGWDLEIVAPCPNSRMTRGAYRQAWARRGFLEQLTRSTKASRRPSEPNIRVWNQEGVDGFVQQMVEQAVASFEAFVVKLEGKVGEHSAASMMVEGTWSYSVVEVTTPNGVERWKTQQILNVSVLGKLFNQWPTRKMKG